MPDLCVLLCTYNPRLDYLGRVLQALKVQTLDQARWTLFVVDNASTNGIPQDIDLSWHQDSRVLQEPKIGKWNALVRGVQSSPSQLFLIVDDDNVLAPNYLEECLEISHQWPRIGAWSGCVVPEFEVPPPEELCPYLHYLCIRPLTRDVWTNQPDIKYSPWGAGMCVRRPVFEEHMQLLLRDDRRASLDRTGDSFSTAGDIDLCLTALQLGFGWGLFPRLQLTHLLRKERLTKSHVLRLIREAGASYHVVMGLRQLESSPSPSRIDKFVAAYKYLRCDSMQRDVFKARRRGLELGLQVLASFPRTTPR